MSIITQNYYFDWVGSNPPDSTDYYISGGIHLDTGIINESNHNTNIPVDATLINVAIKADVIGTLGSGGEAASVFLHKNSSTNTAIGSIRFNARHNKVNTTVDIDLLTTDFFSFKIAYPVFSTNPTNVVITVRCTFEVPGDDILVWQRYWLDENRFSPPDSTNYYFGANSGSTMSIADELHQFSPPFDGKIIGANLSLHHNTNGVVDDLVKVRLRKNSSSNLAVTEVWSWSSKNSKTVVVLDHDVLATDKFSWRVLFPAFTVNPTNTISTYSLLFKKS